MAERRIVTVLFCDVTGSTAMASLLDPEEWGEIMNEAFSYLITPVERYEGTVARLMGDAILAFFGAPHAHEDDPQRAVMAALDILEGIVPYRERINQQYGLDFNVRIGINTGLVVVGEFGSVWKAEYTAMGDAINLAARMQQAAEPGAIQISQATYNLIAPLFEVEPLKPIEVKGKDRPEPAYRVLGRKAQPGSLRGIAGLSVPTVGRDRESGLLRQALEDLWQGHGQVICLIGEAGLGKSRLIDDLYAEWKTIRAQFTADPNGLLPAWFSSHAVSFESAIPYGVIQRWIREIFGITEHDSLIARREKLTGRLQQIAPELGDRSVQVAESLLSWSARTAPFVSESSISESERDSLKREIYAVSTSLWRSRGPRRPTVFVAEDLHWADEASLDLLMHWFQLADELPVLFLCSFRPERQSPAWMVKQKAEREYSHRYTEIALSPLTLQESGTMVDALLNVPNVTRELRDIILQKAEGNPLFVEEVVRTLIDQGIVERDESGGESHWRVVPGVDAAQISIPNNLQTLLLERIDRLEAEARHTLQLAAVVGHTFYYRVLQIVLDTQDSLNQHLTMLQRTDLIRELARIPEREYIFRHALTWEAAYSTILRRHRREFHQRVGEAMEQIFADRLEEHAAVLSRHFYEAGDPRAFRYSLLAGDAAFALSANVEAAAHYKRALELASMANPDGEQLIHLYLRYGRALEFTSRYVDALAVYEEMERTAAARNDLHMKLASVLARTAIHVIPNAEWNLTTGQDLAQQALALAQAIGDQEAEAKSLWSLMILEQYQWRDAQAIEYGERSLEIAREHGLREQLAYTLNDISELYFAVGRFPDGLVALEEARQMWVESGNQAMLADNYFKSGFAQYIAGDYAQVLAFAAESMRIGQSIGNLWGQVYGHWLKGFVLYEYGDFADAIEAIEETIRLSSQGELLPPQVYGRAQLGLMYARAGDVDRGLELMEEARGRAAQLSLPEWFDAVPLAQVYLLRRDPDQAEAVIETTSEGTVFSGVNHILIPLLKAEIAVEREEWQPALDIVDELVGRIQRFAIKTFLADALLYRGKALAGLAREDEAREALSQALTIAESLGARRILWPVLWELSKLETRRGNHEEAAMLHQRARDIVEYITGRAGSPALRKTFLNLPDVRDVFAFAGVCQSNAEGPRIQWRNQQSSS